MIMRRIGIICWGPVETLISGYSIRIYSLTEVLSKIFKVIYLLEYTEKPFGKNTYMFSRTPIADNVRKMLLPGNEKVCPSLWLKYFRFVLWQGLNTLKLRNLIKKLDVIILGAELFLPTLILLSLKVGGKRPIIIADPQMLLSEREYRRGHKVFAKLLTIWEKVLFKRSDGIIVLSQQMMDKIKAILGSNYGKTMLIFPHMLPKDYRRRIICRDKRRKGEVTLAFVGKLSAKHNLESALLLIKLVGSICNEVRNKSIKLYLIGEYDEPTREVLLGEIKRLKSQHVVQIELTGYVKNLDEFICKNVNVLVAPMFTMSGISTKMMYYLRFEGKIIVASREACEGLEDIIIKHQNVIVAYTPSEFKRRLSEIISSF